MANREIKLNSKQGGSFNRFQNIIDYEIDSGLTIDMAKSYVNLQCHCETVEPVDGVFNFKMVYSHNGEPHALTAPNTAMVRNCQLRSANKGMLEDIRRSDVLRTNLHYLNKTTEDNDGTLYKQLLPHRTRTNHTQNMFRDLKGEGSVQSRNLTAPVQIALSELYNLGSAKIDTDFLGVTQIHLEISPERFVPVQLFDGSASTDFGSPLFRNMEDQGPGAPASGIFTVVSSNKYEDLADSPYWVGMPVTVEYTITVQDAQPENVTYDTFIDEIEYVSRDLVDADMVGRLKITLRGDFQNAPQPNDVFTNIKLAGSSAEEYGGLVFTVDYAELVLQEADPVKMDGMVYTTYTLQETNGFGSNNFAEQFIVEPSAYNIMILALNENDLLTQRAQVKEYRLRIDNVDATDRNVVVGSNLYLDRLSMYQTNNGESLKSAVLHVPSATAVSNPVRYTELPLTPFICNPLPVTNTTKFVDMNLISIAEGVSKVMVFKSVIKQL